MRASVTLGVPARLRRRGRFDFATHAEAAVWDDPSEEGVLGAHVGSRCVTAHCCLTRRFCRCAGQLFTACEEGDVDAVRALAPGASAHLDAWGPDGDTLLHTAAVYGFADVVEELLRCGASPSVKDENQGTALVRPRLCVRAW